jgi:poly(A) polymerase
VRVATALELKIDPPTWSAVKKLAPLIRKISAERIRDELTRLLCSGHANRGLELLRKSGLLKLLLPEVEAMTGVKHSPDFHPEGDVWVHTKLVMSKLPKPQTGRLTPVLAWATLLHDVGKPPTRKKKKVRGRLRWRFPGHAEVGEAMARRILQRLKFSRAEIDAICAIVGNHMTFKDVTSMRLSTLKRLMARPTFEEELDMHHADCLGSHGMLKNYNFLRRKRRELAKESIRPKPLVTGRDLLAMGLREGPQIGELLRQVEEKQLEGDLKSRDEALKWLRLQLDLSK